MYIELPSHIDCLDLRCGLVGLGGMGVVGAVTFYSLISSFLISFFLS